MYDRIDPTHRVSVVVHEYYHVIQIERCNVPSPTPMVWLMEGAAAYYEHAYVAHYFDVTPRPTLTSGNDFAYHALNRE